MAGDDGFGGGKGATPIFKHCRGGGLKCMVRAFFGFILGGCRMLGVFFVLQIVFEFFVRSLFGTAGEYQFQFEQLGVELEIKALAQIARRNPRRVKMLHNLECFLQLGNSFVQLKIGGLFIHELSWRSGEDRGQIIERSRQISLFVEVADKELCRLHEMRVQGYCA